MSNSKNQSSLSTLFQKFKNDIDSLSVEDLQKVINEEGCHDEYKNGNNQYGKKASADLQAYNSLIKNYNSISDRLERLLPAEKKKSKLDEMIRDG